MLISLKVNNCFVFNDETEFSMRADMRNKRFSSNVVKYDSCNILKSAIIIGPNNSGKTCLIKVVKMIKNIILDQPIVSSRNLFSENHVCSFEVDFLEDNSEYIFAVKLDEVRKEYVYEKFAEIRYDEYKNRKESIYILRDSSEHRYECLDDEVANLMKVASKNNLIMNSFDSTQFTILEKIKHILMSFVSKIDIVDMNNIPINKTLDILKASDEKKQKVVNFIVNADLYLDDIKYISDDEVKSSYSIIKSNDDELKAQENILNAPASLYNLLHMVSVYKGRELPSILFDSTGTKKITAIASYVIDALEQGKILIVDELDNSLHFKLTRAIISMFNNDLNQKGQLICTIHDVSLLDCRKLFRKDQIWFTHKDSNRAYLYSLAEFTAEEDGVRSDDNIIEKYRKGVFGALPDPDLFSALLEVTNNG